MRYVSYEKEYKENAIIPFSMIIGYNHSINRFNIVKINKRMIMNEKAIIYRLGSSDYNSLH